MEAVYRKRGGRVDDRLTLRPFPQEAPHGMTLKETWTRYRAEMLSHAGAVVFVSGNKRAGDAIVLADGCLEEFEIAKRLGRTPVPIGCTGHAAAQIWEQVHAAVEQFFPGDPTSARDALAILNDGQAEASALIKAVITLLEIAGRPQ
jgi:hypothetical protein